MEVLANHAGERATPTLVAYEDGKTVRTTSLYLISMPVFLMSRDSLVSDDVILMSFPMQVIGRSAKQSLHRNSKNTVSHMTLLVDKE